MPERLQGVTVAAREVITRHREHAFRHQVEKHRAVRGQLREGRHAAIAFDLPAELAEPADHRLGDVGRPAAGQRPAARVSGGQHQHADGPGAGLVKRQEAVRGSAGEQRPGFAALEENAGERERREQTRSSEPGQEQRVPWRARRPQDHVEQVRHSLHERRDEAPVRGAIAAQPRRGLRHRAVR